MSNQLKAILVTAAIISGSIMVGYFFTIGSVLALKTFTDVQRLSK